MFCIRLIFKQLPINNLKHSFSEKKFLNSCFKNVTQKIFLTGIFRLIFVKNNRNKTE